MHFAVHCTNAAGSLGRNVTEAALRTIRLSPLPVLLALLCASPAAATTADELCAPTDDPCVVNRSVNVTNNSIIDVGNRTLRIANNGTLTVGSGMMTLRAATLRVDSGGRLMARGSTDNGGGRIVVEAGIIDIAGLTDLNGAPGGIATLTSSDTLSITGTVQARGLGVEDTGGTIELTGATISVGGTLDAQGGFFDFGGDITATAANTLTVIGTILASGGDGGIIDLSSGGTLSINNAGVVRASASGTAGSGGDVSIAAAGALRFDGEIAAAGRNGSAEDGGGDGGQVSLSGATVTTQRSAARIIATSGSPDGLAGDVDITAEQGSLEFLGRIDAFAVGTQGGGGSIVFDAVGDASIGGTHDAGGGSGGGGDIDLTSGAQLTIVTGATLTTAGSSGGDGGDIDADAAGEVTVQGALVSDGGSGAIGGSVALTACTVRLAKSGRLSAQGAEGINTLTGRDLTFVEGTLRAGSGGANQIRFAAGHDPQIASGATIVPAASLIVDASVIPCSPEDATPTATRTETPTPLPSETPTHTPTFTQPPMSPSPTPAECVGDCDGDGEVTVSDLIVGVNIALGNQPVSACPAFDPSGDGMVSIGELIQGVNNALDGC